MLLTMNVNVERMAEAVHQDFSNATDLADYLVRKGLPFRQAHEVVGKCVAYAIAQEKFLPEISLSEYKKFSELFEADLLEALKPENLSLLEHLMVGLLLVKMQSNLLKVKKFYKSKKK